MVNLIYPGDSISIPERTNVVTGPGIYLDPKSQHLKPINVGIEVIDPSKRVTSVYLDFNSKRYIPSEGDFVIGVITSTFADSYRVSLANFSTAVTLSYMAFPNASKKNRPTLKVGDLLYARVSKANKELEAEIECVDSSTGKDAGYGHLDGGVVVDVSLAFCRELLFNNDFPLLKLIGKRTEFEVAIGLNGKIWIKAADILSTLACYRIILDCEKQPTSQYSEIIKNRFKELANSAD
ncbi:LAMI_0C00606g1_1 [Lachancea mirantina]|uniref:Ribosomal RNA-processing protein 40 n=1 Tax=Lachancea mirantina TaxID=1230905 RepID=A0A1G4IZW0_9SACH|nr:LAMI_0C00606g1_1 [Lachancea mirantina]